MPKLTVEGHGTYDVPAGKKLVLAIEDAGIKILHRCGGVPACTTCRCQVISGDVPPMTTKEEEALEDPRLIASWRLSCQLRVDGGQRHIEFFTDQHRQRREHALPHFRPGDPNRDPAGGIQVQHRVHRPVANRAGALGRNTQLQPAANCESVPRADQKFASLDFQ